MISTPHSPLLILDTNVTSLLMGNSQHQDTLKYKALITGKPLGLPVAVVAELMQGALIDGWGNRRREALIAFLNRFVLLEATFDMAHRWASIRAECRRHGVSISENDAWIAATALSLTCDLVSHDRAHLRMQTAVPQLRVLSLLNL